MRVVAQFGTLDNSFCVLLIFTVALAPPSSLTHHHCSPCFWNPMAFSTYIRQNCESWCVCILFIDHNTYSTYPSSPMACWGSPSFHNSTARLFNVPVPSWWLQINSFALPWPRYVFLTSSTQLNWHFYLRFQCVWLTDRPESKDHTEMPQNSSSGWLHNFHVPGKLSHLLTSV